MPYSERYGFIEDIGEKTDNRCHICHEEAHPDDYGSSAGPLGRHATTVDHLVPQSEGGSDDPDNLLLAHAGCNSSRGTRPAEEARLEWAGTTEKPLSTTEELALFEWQLEAESIEPRQGLLRGLGIAVLVGLGVAVLGGLAYWLSTREKKASGEDKKPDPSTPSKSPLADSITTPSRTDSAMQIDRKTFEQALLTYLEQRGERNSTQARLLSQLDQAELVTVRGSDRDALEVWIPGWDTLVGDVRAELQFEDVTLHVGAPDPNGQAQIDPRMDVVQRRPLFS